MHNILYIVSIVSGYALGYLTALKYAIIDRKSGKDISEKLHDIITPPRTRIISPHKKKTVNDLLKGLDDE